MSVLTDILVFNRALTCFIDSELFLNHVLVSSSSPPSPFPSPFPLGDDTSTEYNCPCQQQHHPVGKYRFTEGLKK